MDSFQHYILVGYDVDELIQIRDSKRFHFESKSVRRVGPFHIHFGIKKYKKKNLGETKISKEAVVVHWPLAPDEKGDLVIEFLLNDGSAQRVIEAEEQKEFDKLQALVYSMLYHTMSFKYVLGLMERIWEAGISHGRKERSGEFLRLLFDGQVDYLEDLAGVVDWWRRGG